MNKLVFTSKNGLINSFGNLEEIFLKLAQEGLGRPDDDLNCNRLLFVMTLFSVYIIYNFK